jgi:hypothetical protein
VQPEQSNNMQARARHRRCVHEPIQQTNHRQKAERSVWRWRAAVQGCCPYREHVQRVELWAAGVELGERRRAVRAVGKPVVLPLALDPAEGITASPLTRRVAGGIPLRRASGRRRCQRAPLALGGCCCWPRATADGPPRRKQALAQHSKPSARPQLSRCCCHGAQRRRSRSRYGGIRL